MTANGQDKKAKALHFGRRAPGGHKWNTHEFVIPAGTDIEDLKEPGYWRHYVNDMKPSDIAECFCEDGSWEASFRVMFVSRAEVKLSLRWSAEHDKTDIEDSDTHEVSWGGPAVRFRVIRKDTKEVIKDNLYPKSEAYDYMKKHLQALRS